MIGKQETECTVKCLWRLTDYLAPCRHQLYWRKTEQQKINSNKQKLFIVPTLNYEPWAFCILHVQEHDVNTTVLQQEAKDKTWWTISSSWALARHYVFVYVMLYEVEVTNTNNLFGNFSLFTNCFKLLPINLLFLNTWLLFSKRHVHKCYTICSL